MEQREQNKLVRCPYCGGEETCRASRNAKGQQRYHCLNQACGKTFLPGARRIIPTWKKDVVMGLLQQNVPPRTIANAIQGISLRYIERMRQRKVVGVVNPLNSAYFYRHRA
jgi:transposase-like protein